MNKKVYKVPAMSIVCIQHNYQILSGSVNEVTSGDAGLNYGGGGSGTARARQYSDWDDECDD